jgi:hypothetical protein
MKFDMPTILALYLLNKSGQIGEFKNVIPCLSIRCGLVSMKLPGFIEKLPSTHNILWILLGFMFYTLF